MATPTVGESVVRIPIYKRGGAVLAFAVVSPCDRDLLSRRWYLSSVGYVKSSYVYMHRRILGLKRGDGMFADHINGDKLDNRRENLRAVDAMGNAQNSRQNRKNTSGYRNVTWNASKKRWQVVVKYLGKSHYGGVFRSVADAASAAAAKRKEFGFLDANPARATLPDAGEGGK